LSKYVKVQENKRVLHFFYSYQFKKNENI
jgi:hypothetical protein